MLLSTLFACIEPPPPLPPDEISARGESASTPEVIWEGRAPGELYAPGEIRGFEIHQGDRLIGRSWGRYVGPQSQGNAESPGKSPPQRHRFETRTELLLPGRPPARAEGMVLLDGRGHLVRGYERSEAVELRFTRDGELLRLTDGTREDEVLYDPLRRDTAFMAHSAIFHEELMLGLRRLTADPMEWRVVSLSGGAPVEWEGTLARVPRTPDDEAVIRTSLGEEITLREGRLLRSVVPASGVRIEAMAQPQWPSWSIEGPPTLRYETPADASFEPRELELPGREGEPALFGELLVPDGRTSPGPAILWISGTGREDRHGFAGPPPVDLGSHEITDALANAGLAVLRFDERGQGRSEPGPLTFSAQLEDVRRAYRTLVVQPEVDPDRVILVAHGEGSLRALSLAAQQGPAIAGVALLGSPGRPLLEMLRHQGEVALAGVPPELREKAKEQQAAMMEQLRKGEIPPELADHEGWLREALGLDPARMVARLEAPLLIAQGDKDFEVDPTTDPAALQAAGRSRGKGPSTVVHHYPELDHLFKPEPGRSDPSRYRDRSRSVDPKFLADLVAWAQQVTRSPQSGSKPKGNKGKTKRRSR